MDLLDADHKAVKKMFIDHAALAAVDAPEVERHRLAQRIAAALGVHAQIEEEIFYPGVREALGDDALIEEAKQEHAQAKALVARIEGMRQGDAGLDAAVLQLGVLIDGHVLEEREQIFLRARLSAMDLRGMTLALVKRQAQLKKKAASSAAMENA